MPIAYGSVRCREWSRCRIVFGAVSVQLDFFEVENPARRVLVDCHKPFGVHVHFDDGPQIRLGVQTVDEAREAFAAAIKKHFGADVETL